MPSPADRFKLWLESVSDSWKDRLRGWLLRAVGEGIESFTTHLEPAFIDAARTELQKLLADPNVPQSTKNILTQALKPGNILTTIFAEILMLLQAIPVLLGGSAPLSREVEYLQDRLKKTFRFDPNVATQLWLRDKLKYAWSMEDLKDLGMADEQIEAVQTLASAIPGVADIIRFAVREVYTPEIAKLFGQYEDFPEAGMADAEKAGLSRDLFTKQWAAHWLLPSSDQGFEMLHRRILTEAELKTLLKALDIMPFWRDKLIKLSWNVLTRVDVRRMWEMRTINEARLAEVYEAEGYHDQDLKDMVLWTKIYTDFPDLLARYKNGWISLDQVKSEVIAMGMSPERADTLIQEKIKKSGQARIVTEKDITRTDILNGVKKGKISRAEGAELLQDIGYSVDEAEFVLLVNVPTDEEEANKNIRELSKSDIKEAVINRILTPQQATTELIKLRYTSADATFLIKIYSTLIKPEKLEADKELAKGDITGALKRGIITPAVATKMLTDLKYSDTDVKFLVDSNMPEAAKVKEEEKRTLAKAEIMLAMTVGQITAEQAASRLVDLKYSTEDASFLVTLYQKVESITKATQPKEASKADIVTAVKKGLITPEDGYVMLIELGFSAEASIFILSLVAETSPFSPMSYGEFKDITTKYRLATGTEAIPMSEELKRVAAELVQKQKDVEALRAAVAAEQKTLIESPALPDEVVARRKALQVSLHRAESALAEVQSRYSSLVAEWKQKAR